MTTVCREGMLGAVRSRNEDCFEAVATRLGHVSSRIRGTIFA